MHSQASRAEYFPKVFIARLVRGEKITFPLAQGKYVRFDLSKHVRVSTRSLLYSHSIDRVSYRSNFLLRVNGTIDRRIQGTVDTRCSS